MADWYGYVIYKCEWCGQSFHDVDDDHSMVPIAVYMDSEGRRFCSEYCKDMLNVAENTDIGF